MFGFHRKRKISDLEVKLSLAEIKKRAKILVIDDEPASFPTERLCEEGYHIECWESVKSISRLEDGEFDVIILDYAGVADDLVSLNAGLGVLEHIKKINPSQLVVAFSAHSFDAKRSNFWRLADDNLGKPIDVIRCKEVLDQLLLDKFNLAHYWLSMAKILKDNGVSGSEITAVEMTLVNSLKRGDKGAVMKLLEGITQKIEISARLGLAVSKIFAIFGA